MPFYSKNGGVAHSNSVPAADQMVAAFDLSPGFIRRLNGEIVTWTSGCERLYGWTKQEAEGRISHKLLRTEFPKPLNEIEAELLEQNSWQGELGQHTAFGKRIFVASSWIMQRVGGDPWLVVEVNSDITHRLEAHHASALLAAIVEGSDDAIIGLNLGGRITAWNRGAEKLFGYYSAEIAGDRIEKIVPGERLAEGREMLKLIARGERLENLRTIRITKAKERVVVSLTVSPIRDELGRIVGISVTARDMTGRHRMEQALRGTNEALDQFAYAAAHDLQEPLRNVALSLELAEAEHVSELAPECRELMRCAIDNTVRMQAMIRDLLAYSRATWLEAGPTEGLRCDANQVLWSVRNNLESSIRSNDATIFSTRLPQVGMAEIHLLQVLQNIVANAIKYRSNEIPEIHVSAEERDGDWLFSVSDNGIGIPPQFQQRVFGVFKRLHLNGVSGTGIGLALCKRIIEYYGGEIGIKSNVGEGVTVFFSAPRYKEEIT